MTWMLAIPASEVLPLKSPIGRGASIACDECRVVFVRRHDAAAIFPTLAHAIAACTTFCEGWVYEGVAGGVVGEGRLTCLDCIAAQEVCGLDLIRPVVRSEVIRSEYESEGGLS